ncbi:unnamed protein product, partial [Closterium sp. Naga37s-1]
YPCPIYPCPIYPCPIYPCPIYPCPIYPCPIYPCPIYPCPIYPCPIYPCPIYPCPIYPCPIYPCPIYPCPISPSSPTPTLPPPGDHEPHSGGVQDNGGRIRAAARGCAASEGHHTRTHCLLPCLPPLPPLLLPTSPPPVATTSATPQVITNLTRAGCKTLEAAFVLRHEDVITNPCPIYPCPIYPCPIYPCPIYPCPIYPCPIYPCPIYPCPIYPCPIYPCPISPSSPTPTLPPPGDHEPHSGGVQDNGGRIRAAARGCAASEGHHTRTHCLLPCLPPLPPLLLPTSPPPVATTSATPQVITNLTRAGCKTLEAAFVLRHEDVPRVKAITHALTAYLQQHPRVDKSKGPAMGYLKQLTGSGLQIGVVASIKDQHCHHPQQHPRVDRSKGPVMGYLKQLTGSGLQIGVVASIKDMSKGKFLPVQQEILEKSVEIILAEGALLGESAPYVPSASDGAAASTYAA